MRWVSVKELAAFLGYHEQTIWTLIQEGKVAARRVGQRGSWRIAVDEHGWPLAPVDETSGSGETEEA